LKFSLLSLFGAVLLAAITFSSLRGGMGSYALLRNVAYISFLTAVLVALYSRDHRRPFAGGWAICSGVTLALVFLGVPILGSYLQVSPDPHYGIVIDVAFSVILAYLGGSLAAKLSSRRSPDSCE
jgi:hypothetical protein